MPYNSHKKVHIDFYPLLGSFQSCKAYSETVVWHTFKNGLFETILFQEVCNEPEKKKRKLRNTKCIWAKQGLILLLSARQG